jgi:hypothetical protein
MKKLFLTLGAVGVLALTSQATLILNETFSYTDGSITANSGGVWTNHSGTAGQVDVTSGVVNVSQLESEDISAPVTGGPYATNGYLYASMKVNFSALPTGAGGYFWHFKPTGNDFRARLWANTAGAVAGTFRVGIAAGSGTAVFIPVDLTLGAEYKLVVRYNTTNASSTLWISPTSEAAVTSRADSTDIPGAPVAPPIVLVSLRQSTSGGAGMGVMTLDDLLVGTAFTDVQTVGGPPSISGLVPVSIPASSNTGPLPFLVSDVETAANDLTVTATSSNPTLVPNNPANLTLGGSGANRTLTVTPATSQEGTASIEVVVTDGNSDTATNTFIITVGLPSISAIPAQSGVTNSVIGPVAFTVGDNETAPGSLTVTATSSNQLVITDSDIGIQNLGGGNRSISVTNVGGAGLTEITVTVADGTHTVSSKFLVTAYPLLGVILADDFTYPDGSIITNSSFFWNAHSGTTGQTQVASGKINLASAQGEDINAFLTNASYAPGGGFVFYSRFVVNFSALPTGNGGDYFAHFKDFTTGFRARVFAMTNGAASGKYRLGIANGGFTTTGFPQDLSLGTPVVVITRYDLGAGTSTIWVNPTSESSTSLSAADGASSSTIYSYAFRQGGSSGNLSVDDLKVATSFNEVLINLAPIPEALQYQVIGSDIVLSWTSPSFSLQAAPLVSGTYTNIPGATSPYTTSMTGDQRYFRLSYP